MAKRKNSRHSFLSNSPLVPTTRRQREYIHARGHKKSWPHSYRPSPLGFKVVTNAQLDYKFKYPSALYKAKIDLECYECCRRIKATESFWRSWRGNGWAVECLRCRPVAKY